jgi:hypothetical protein
MDRLFFASVVARERKDEITKELAVRHMLKEAEENLPRAPKSKGMMLRFAPSVLVVSLIIIYHFG